MKYNKTATVQRLEAEEDNPNIKSWQDNSIIRIMFLPSTNRTGQEMKQIASAEGIIGKAYMVYCDFQADVKVTDRMVIDEMCYDVRGVNKFEGSQKVDHLEILIEERKT